MGFSAKRKVSCVPHLRCAIMATHDAPRSSYSRHSRAARHSASLASPQRGWKYVRLRWNVLPNPRRPRRARASRKDAVPSRRSRPSLRMLNDSRPPRDRLRSDLDCSSHYSFGHYIRRRSRRSPCVRQRVPRNSNLAFSFSSASTSATLSVDSLIA